VSSPDLRTAQWFKSSYSSNNGTCVEVAFLPGGVAARDSKDHNGGALIIDPATFRAFLHAVTTPR
jgi:hypothetical protein